MRYLARRLPLLGAASVWCLTSCTPDDPKSAPVHDVVLVSATGTFDTTEGELSISVSPKDDAGNFVGQELPESAFSFEAVTIAPVATPNMTADMAMDVSEVVVNQPDPGSHLTAVVIFDSSGSMATNDPGATGRRRGGQALFDVLREDDEIAVLDFGAGTTTPFVVSRMLQDFTSDGALLSAALGKLAQSGGTPLYRSILDGLSLLAQVDADVPALVVLTDGQAEDQGSFAQAAAEARRLSVPIYSIGLGSSLDFSRLSQLAEETAGGFIEASDATALEHAFAGVSSGVSLGAVVVHGRGRYELPGGRGRYRVSGKLVTVDGRGERIETPFSLTVEVS